MLELAQKGRRGQKSASPDRDRRSTLVLPGYMEASHAAPLISRDHYLVETGIKIDRLQRELTAATTELAATKSALSRLSEDAAQTRRFHDFLDRETRARLSRLELIEKSNRDLKSRLDHIEGRRGGNYQGFATFEAVSIRLTELGELERLFKEWLSSLRLAGWLAAAGAFAVLALAFL